MHNIRQGIEELNVIASSMADKLSDVFKRMQEDINGVSLKDLDDYKSSFSELIKASILNQKISALGEDVSHLTNRYYIEAFYLEVYRNSKYIDILNSGEDLSEFDMFKERYKDPSDIMKKLMSILWDDIKSQLELAKAISTDKHYITAAQDDQKEAHMKQVAIREGASRISEINSLVNLISETTLGDIMYINSPRAYSIIITARFIEFTRGNSFDGKGGITHVAQN